MPQDNRVQKYTFAFIQHRMAGGSGADNGFSGMKVNRILFPETGKNVSLQL